LGNKNSVKPITTAKYLFKSSKLIQMQNSKSQAGTEVQQSDEVDVTTSAPITPNPLLAVVLFLEKVITKRNVLYSIFIYMVVKSLFVEINYTMYAVIFLVGIYFEICDLVDLTKQKQQIIINNKIEQNLINETGLPLTIKNEN